jgi:hypothetical protein
MNPIHDTAYPLLSTQISDDELRTVYTPTAAELRFVLAQFRQAPTRVIILTQLKLLQRLGYVPLVSALPASVVEHICAARGEPDHARVAVHNPALSIIVNMRSFAY